MITFKAIAAAPRKDGIHPVKIRVTFKRKSRWLPTTLTATAGELTRTGKIKDQTLLSKCDDLISKLRANVSDLSPFTVEVMDVDGVIAHIKRANRVETFKLDFIQFGREAAAKASVSSGKQINTALNAFARFLGRDSVDVNDITVIMLRNFVEFVDSEPVVVYNPWEKTAAPTAKKKAKKKGVTARMHVSRLASVYRRARDRYNDEDTGVVLIPRDPFSRIHVKSEGGDGAQENLGPAVIQKIIDAKDVRPAARFALDCFMVSFGLMGVNLADLYAATPPVDGVWTYERKKTRGRRRDRARMEVKVPDVLAPYLERLKDPTDSGYWLRLHLKGKNAPAVNQKINRALRNWAEENGLEPFTMYAARHSWASIARSKAVGIDKATVDDCLNHATMALADIYIERDFEVFNDANAKVLNIFSWENAQN